LKILLLSDANSIHTQRWVKSISANGFEINLFSLFSPSRDSNKKYNKYNVKIISPDLKSNINNLREPNISKIKYLKSIPLLKRIIKDFKPDILHAHYASSYGILGLLSGFKPFILSVWGSDINHFPYQNKFNSWIIRLVIKNADVVCSTSKSMKEIIENEYKRYDVKLIPFGIDIDLFNSGTMDKKKFTVGTIKSIEEHNGIDCLLNAAKLIIYDYNIDIDFIIVGGGSMLNEMQKMAVALSIENNVKFVGQVDHEEVIKYYNCISIFIAVSRRESFGVSVLEAAACEIPSITSNVGGLTEVNVHYKTGFVVNPDDPVKLAESIIELYRDENLRLGLGIEARKRVINQFNWNDNVNQMINIYKSHNNQKNI